MLLLQRSFERDHKLVLPYYVGAKFHSQHVLVQDLRSKTKGEMKATLAKYYDNAVSDLLSSSTFRPRTAFIYPSGQVCKRLEL